ncbi:hypothetical protein [Mycobacterium uberis]|uniref:hypothetical protein n=1 Tax=Mycobacterium uberis TaxID=2162698 RepID=UPI0014041247|nr:hypothetical protein [Mycobacterium uberis]
MCLTTTMLTIYFVLAVGFHFHVKVRDLSVVTAAAAANITIFAVMTAKKNLV